jgi:type IV pilus assembly protein PilM
MRLGRGKRLVGLVFRSGEIVAVEAEADGRVLRAVSAPLAPGVVVDGEVGREAELVVALRDLWSRERLAKSVRVGVVSSKAALRSFRVPWIADEKKRTHAIAVEARERLPIPARELSFAYQVAARRVDEHGHEFMDVVAAGMRRESVEELERAISSAGLRCEGIDLGPCALLRAFPNAPQPAEVLEGESDEESPEPVGAPARVVCELADTFSVAIEVEGVCGFARVARVGLGDIAVRLASRVEGLDADGARRWLAYVGLERDLQAIDGDPTVVAEARAALVDGAAVIATELRNTVSTYLSGDERAGAVPAIVLCGPGSALEGLAKALAAELGIPTTPLLPPALATLENSVDAGGTAAGLVARSGPAPLDLRGEATQPRRPGRAPTAMRGALVGAAAAGALGFAAMTLAGGKVSSQEERLASAQAAQAEARAQSESFARYAEVRDDLATRRETVARILQTRMKWGEVFDELAIATPEDVRFDSVTASLGPSTSASPAAPESAGASQPLRSEASGPALELTGCAGSADALASLLRGLRAMSSVEDVGLSQTGDGSSEATASATPTSSGSCSGGSADTFSIVVGFDAAVIGAQARVPEASSPESGTSEEVLTDAGEVTP